MWVGVFTRADTKETGPVSTSFLIEDGKLAGWHYDPSMKMENITVISRDKVSFGQKYGSCKATHEFKILDVDTKRAQSSYTVSECANEKDVHRGDITYGQVP